MTSTFPAVATTYSDEKTHRRMLAEASNRHNQGKFNVVIEVTLNPLATTTIIRDNRISANSILLFMATTAHAATAFANLYVPETSMFSATATEPGQATLFHASSANTDQTFRVGILG